MDRKDSNDQEDFDMGFLGRKVSACSNTYSFLYDHDPGMKEEPTAYHGTREATFYQKILPGLNCFAVLGDEDKPQIGEMENELNQINTGLFSDNDNHDPSPQQFFNYIERESEYENMKSKRLGKTRLKKIKRLRMSSSMLLNRTTTVSLTASCSNS